MIRRDGDSVIEVIRTGRRNQHSADVAVRGTNHHRIQL
jgi:hypothetical protein